ncbi:MAG: TRAP transporter substrate-binding protein DctP [Desulfatibacillum sp.]|nr:TRAP transporter substrate-binding protein DctP [Desulfatibacillum sp.]
MKFRKISLLLVLAVAFFTALSQSALAGEASVWKIATLAPKGVGWARHVENTFLPEIKKATDGSVDLKVFWGGVMGDDEDYVKKMRIGQLDGAGMTAQGAVMLTKEWAVLEIPFMFTNYGEVDYVRKKMTPAFDQYMEDNGYKLIVWIDQDFDKFYSINHKLTRLEDFSKARIVTWYGELEQRVLERLGASPIPVNVPEIPAALRSGIVDTNIAPAIWMVGTQMYSISRYVNTMNIRYAPAIIVVTREAWDSVSDNHQKNMLGIREELTAKFVAGIREDNQKSLAAMLRYGMVETTPEPEEMEKIKKALAPVAEEMVDVMYPQELLDEMVGYLKEYRTSL